MEPHGRDENQENILEDMIRGDDVSKQFLNDSGEGDESLNRGDGSDAWGERELGGSDEGKLTREKLVAPVKHYKL